MRFGLALVSLALAVSTAHAGAVANDPAPTPTLAPVGLPPAGAAAPEASPSANAPPLKVIERIYVTSFCSRFIQHFNLAANVLIANDTRLDQTSSDLDAVDADYVKHDGALRVYDDRNRLIAEVDGMMRSIPQGQTAVNNLLAQVRGTKDPTRREALQATASQLQRSIDRQRAVAYDLSNTVHVLLDKHTFEDTDEYHIAQAMPYPNMPVIIHTLDDPVPEPGSTDAAQALAPKPATAKMVLQFDRQRWIIAHAESQAAAAAESIVKSCVVEDRQEAPVGN
ncbi:hypothetical protein EPN42_07065 [bacterium]|nr:MAG: hypothetical protein EPN42_07065 [bacterium]